MKTQQTDKWLTDFSGEHLFHELKMFWWLAGNIKPDMDAYLHDALLESFVVHLRNLIDFFIAMDKATMWSRRTSLTSPASGHQEKPNCSRTRTHEQTRN